MNSRVYLDYNATTPVDSRVLDVMLPYFREHYGNPANNTHSFGKRAENAIEKSREQLSRLIGANPREIFFTSGATESNNMVLKGIPSFYEHKGNHIVSVTTEHESVLSCCELHKENVGKLTLLDVDKFGLIKAKDVEKVLSDETLLLSVMMVNNETGVIQPIQKIGKTCRTHGVLFHSDAAQAIGKIPFNVESMMVDLVSISSHKMYGPKGVGALYMRKNKPRVHLTPLIDGGGQEDGIRSGTLNVPAIVGFGEAAQIAMERLEEDGLRLIAQREHLEQGISGQLSNINIIGYTSRRVPGTTNISFSGCNGQNLVKELKGLAVSSGSACNTSNVEPSHVLTSMGLDYDSAMGAVRFSLGRDTTDADIEFTIGHVIETVKKLRTSI